jgi:DNA-binding CsgD family transcriptional regulator
MPREIMNPLVGRAHLLSALDGHLDAAAQGSGGCVVVEGPFGIGRTRLLQAAAQAGAKRGMTVLAGRVSETEQASTLHLLVNFVRHLNPDAADFADLVRPERNPFWLANRLGGLIESAARSGPLLIVLDDAQRIDDVSALALRELVQSPGSAPVLWLLARRPVAAPSLAQHALGWLIDQAAARLQLGPLDSAAVAELCRSILGAEPDPSALDWAARCGGNPWVLETLFGALYEAGQVVIVDGMASVVAERLPEGFLSAVGRVLEDMPPAVRLLVEHDGRTGHGLALEGAPALLGEPISAQDTGCGCGDMAALAISALRGAFDEALPASALRLLAGAGRCAEATRLTDTAVRLGMAAGAEAQLMLELGQGLRDAGCEGMPATPPSCDVCDRPVWTWLIRALGAADRFEEAAAVCATVRQEADRLGEVRSQALWHGHHAELLVATGRLEDACAAAEAALRLAPAATPADSAPARLALAQVSILRGDLATASDQLRRTEQLVSADSAADRAYLNWALAQFHAASDRPAMMVQTLINVEGQVAPDPLLFSVVPTAAATLVRLAGKVGLDAEADRAAAFARRIAERNPSVPSLAGGAEHAEGLLRRDPATLHRAVQLYRRTARPLAAANALEDTAREDRSMRNRARTVRLLQSALGHYLDCGAQLDTARVQRKLRRLGVHDVRGLAADQPKTGWESLTQAELRVVRAIVDGKTNREAASALYLSPHTVDSHLRRVFSKLDINSRVELTKHFIANETSSPVVADSMVAEPRQLRSAD